MADLSITAAQVLRVSGGVSVIQAGEAITAGQVLYRKADSKAWKAISSSAAAAEAIGIALCDAAADQQVAYAPTGAVVNLGAGAAPGKGEVYSVSDTAGGLQPDADIGAAEYLTQVCRAIGTNQVRITILVDGEQHA